MNTTRKALAALGIVALSALAVPAVASASPGMYAPCSASKEGKRISSHGTTLECVQSDGGYDWEDPTAVN